VATTGILATMPYIALQLVGIESVLTVLGVGGNSSNALVRDLPLIIAFVILAAYTYLAGLRAPALIAFVKDALVYATVIVAILYIPARLGGWGHIFGAASAMIYGTVQAYRTPGGGQAHFGASTAPVFGHVTYIAVAALAVNLTVAAAGTLLFRVTGVPNGHDETRPEHYTADPGGAPPGQAAGFPAPGRHRRPGPDSLRGGRARQASPAAAARPRAPE